jgi:undecaprenyl phosphate-alpha-L-ara4N flippase subunit ArnE
MFKSGDKQMTFFLYILVYAIISTTGLVLLKQSAAGVNLPFLSGVFFYGSGFLLWLVILKRFPLSTAFPVAASSLIITTFLAGVFFLKESVSWMNILGVFLILCGITCLHMAIRAG